MTFHCNSLPGLGRALLLLLLPLVSHSTVDARLSLDDNLVFRSPAINHDWLTIDTDAIEDRLVKRSLTDSYLPSLRTTNVNYTKPVTFSHSVASGDPDSESVILWTRVIPTTEFNTESPIPVTYQVSESPDFSGAEQSYAANGSVYTTADVDYTVKVLATGLQPWTVYYYRFLSGNATSPVGRAKTLPDGNYTGTGNDAMKFAVFSCSNYPFGYFNAYGNAARNDRVDYMVHLGDYIYEYGKGEYDLGNVTIDIGRVDDPDHQIVTLADYRARYAHYRADPDLSLNHQNFSWFATWDDHEVADNAYNQGSSFSSDYPAGTMRNVSFTPRKASAIRAYYEWMPVRPHLMSGNLRLYRSFELGKLGDLIILDTRQRDRDVTDLYSNTDFIRSIKDDETRSMMGYEQESWLYDTLKRSKARGAQWRVIAQQVIFSNLQYTGREQNVDSWDGYTANRNRLLKTLKGLNDTNNVVLAGDSHVSWTFDMYYPKSTSANGTYNETYGPFGMELANTGVTSPSPYGKNLTTEAANNITSDLLDINPHLLYADASYHGYFELQVSPSQANATYYAAPDILTRNSRELTGPEFILLNGTGKIEYPYNRGQPAAYGSLRSTDDVTTSS